MKNKLGSIVNYLCALPYLVFGATYLFKNSFMPYHSDAVSLPWEEVDKGMQFLILALMRAVSGGMLLAGIMIIWLQIQFDRTKSAWVPALILASGVLVALTTLYATTIVRNNSPGNPPSMIIIICVIGLAVGFFLNKRAVK